MLNKYKVGVIIEIILIISNRSDNFKANSYKKKL